MPFRKVLIANRGEIAVRIMQTCAEMGIATVAVYSDADSDAPHVHRAGEAVPIGPAPAPQSYLDVARIIDAARKTGAEAIHPGYGFLSENPSFAAACRDAGVTFIGPSPEAMRVLGSKRAAKRLAREARVPVVPGYDDEDQSLETLTREAERVGFPLLIKASAGGGGKGMRAVWSASDLGVALEGARREAKAAFGDDSVLLEKLIDRPRHVEVQLLADVHGTVVHLGERDCSAQRRHQKVIEESPSPAVTAELRRRMGEAAVALAKAAGYVNAGTVEFIVTPDGEFFFLEVNTRLQVEHPVTELVTGLDLVGEQLRIAAGEALSFRQDDVILRGHAIECRLYAEDPSTGFLPSTGTLTRCDLPHGVGIRVDSGVRIGSEVTPYYDPMLAKVIVHAPVRDAAIGRAKLALRRCALEGVATNVGLLGAILDSPSFRSGAVTTRFIDERLQELLSSVQDVPQHDTSEQPSTPAPDFNPWRGAGRMGAHAWRAQRARPTRPGLEGTRERTVSGAGARPGSIVAPLTGTVAKVPVNEGTTVEAGQTVVVLEAMKMEIAVEATRAGVIKHLACGVGDLVQAGQVLAEIGD